ncbi:hypothetical protein ABPG72_014423 [Tetrahymena utriculariae]
MSQKNNTYNSLANVATSFYLSYQFNFFFNLLTKVSKGIKSNYAQCKQLRDGKNRQNVNPGSEEPTKQSPLTSLEQQETMEKSQLKLLYDWKQIQKSRAYRNDQLQNFINTQNPKLYHMDYLKVFNHADDFLSIDQYNEDYKEQIQNSIRYTKELQIKQLLNIYYNREKLNESLKNYDTQELSQHFVNAEENPGRSHNFKMAQVIERYIRGLLIYKFTEERKAGSFKIKIDEGQYQQNIIDIIEALRHIILKEDNTVFNFTHLSSLGMTYISILPYTAIKWEQLNNQQN